MKDHQTCAEVIDSFIVILRTRIDLDHSAAVGGDSIDAVVHSPTIDAESGVIIVQRWHGVKLFLSPSALGNLILLSLDTCTISIRSSNVKRH